MTPTIIELLIVLLGLAVTPILFYRFPRIARTNPKDDLPLLSVIIPARNEATSLPLLLGDLRNQTYQTFEIICGDDDSSDGTAQIAEAFGAKVISLHNKPAGWMGKTWACHNGAAAAQGELLLFLDADVRLGQDAIQRLLATYSEERCTLSVQPYHATERWYEQCSLLFNLIQIAANGTALKRPKSLGLCGPVILMARTDYRKIGGHESVRNRIVEDVALGQRLKSAALPYRLFVGDETIAYRMYPLGIRSLFQGWIKNIAAGAGKTPRILFGMVFLWITAMTSVPIQAVRYAVSKNLPWFILYVVLYFLWVGILFSLSRGAGCFRWPAIVLYPILVSVLLVIFSISLVKTLFGMKVVWKDRRIREDQV